MELLEFARGPALTFAITIFIAGIVFRIVSLFALWRTKDSSAGSPREKSAFSAALREVIRRLWPQAVYKQDTMFELVVIFCAGVGVVSVLKRDRS